MPRHPSHDLYTSNAALAPDATPLALLSPLSLSKDDECHHGMAHSVRRSSTRISRISHQRQWRRRYCSRGRDVGTKMHRKGPERVIASFRTLRLEHFRRKHLDVDLNSWRNPPHRKCTVYRERVENNSCFKINLILSFDPNL